MGLVNQLASAKISLDDELQALLLLSSLLDNWETLCELVSKQYVPMDGKNNSFQGMIVLNSNNYSVWKNKMEALLIVKYLYEPIDKK